MELPRKLEKDSIIEAICEIRFETDSEPEVVVGRFSDSKFVANYIPQRLPASDIPASVRQSNLEFKYQPILALKSEQHPYLVKVGSNVVSFHVVGQHSYCGWNKYQERLFSMIETLFTVIPDAKVVRLGFRYVNALNKTDHQVDSIAKLDMKLSKGKIDFLEKVNINYHVINKLESHESHIRIATADFVEGSLLPLHATVYIDVDVMTPSSYETNEKETVKQWVDDAHGYEKQEFFSLFTIDHVKTLEGNSND